MGGHEYARKDPKMESLFNAAIVVLDVVCLSVSWSVRSVGRFGRSVGQFGWLVSQSVSLQYCNLLILYIFQLYMLKVSKKSSHMMIVVI